MSQIINIAAVKIIAGKRYLIFVAKRTRFFTLKTSGISAKIRSNNKYVKFLNPIL
jgi:hypothetical protein